MAMPSLSGPGGLITIPSAYVKSGGVVAPSAAISDSPQTITSLNYALGNSMELGLQQTEHNGTGTNFKYQLAADKNGAEGTPAGAIGFLDQRMEHTTLLSSQMRIVGEYNGSKRDVNSGIIYNFTEAMGSFIYMMDIESSGLNSDMITGFTFNLAF